MEQLPVIAITMGDPASIGPELSARAFADPALYTCCRPLLIGDGAVMEKAVALLGLTLTLNIVQSPAGARFTPGTLDMIDLGLVDMRRFRPGEVSAMCGNAAFGYVKKAIELAMTKQVDATVTNALNKEAMNLAGHHYAGHTEIYAHYTGTPKYTMLLADGNLRVVHVSTHVSLREACERVKRDRVLEVIGIAHSACRRLGIESPRVAVAGLNPHSGENGLFGREEIEEITPAIEDARAQGIRVDGPVPPDTLFSKVRGGMYDIAVAMYHDQGHIPLKVTGFVYDQQAGRWLSVKGVNVTLGLPVVRTSVDHGTAFDQAWQGVASADSLQNAVQYAVQMAANPQTHIGPADDRDR